MSSGHGGSPQTLHTGAQHLGVLYYGDASLLGFEDFGVIRLDGCGDDQGVCLGRNVAGPMPHDHGNAQVFEPFGGGAAQAVGAAYYCSMAVEQLSQAAHTLAAYAHHVELLTGQGSSAGW